MQLVAAVRGFALLRCVRFFAVLCSHDHIMITSTTLHARICRSGINISAIGMMTVNSKHVPRRDDQVTMSCDMRKE